MLSRKPYGHFNRHMSTTTSFLSKTDGDVSVETVTDLISKHQHKNEKLKLGILREESHG